MESTLDSDATNICSVMAECYRELLGRQQFPAISDILFRLGALTRALEQISQKGDQGEQHLSMWTLCRVYSGIASAEAFLKHIHARTSDDGKKAYRATDDDLATIQHHRCQCSQLERLVDPTPWYVDSAPPGSEALFENMKNLLVGSNWNVAVINLTKVDDDALHWLLREGSSALMARTGCSHPDTYVTREYIKRVNIERIQKLLQESMELPVMEIHLMGSTSRKTNKKQDELFGLHASDQDFLLVLDTSFFATASDVDLERAFVRVESELRRVLVPYLELPLEGSAYGVRVTRGKYCVSLCRGVPGGGDFWPYGLDIDVVPSRRRREGNYEIFNTEGGVWIPTDPFAHSKAFEIAVDAHPVRRFVANRLKVVNSKLPRVRGEGKAPLKGIHIEALVMKWEPQVSRDMEEDVSRTFLRFQLLVDAVDYVVEHLNEPLCLAGGTYDVATYTRMPADGEAILREVGVARRRGLDANAVWKEEVQNLQSGVTRGINVSRIARHVLDFFGIEHEGLSRPVVDSFVFDDLLGDVDKLSEGLRSDRMRQLMGVDTRRHMRPLDEFRIRIG